MKKYHSPTWSLIALICALGTALYLLCYMITEPGNVMCGISGDSGKNYFTYLYHAAYDHGFWFHGMNYPYGDNVIYADGQPIISTLLQLFRPLNPHTILAVMNLLLSFSFVIAILFTYKILLRFQVLPYIAVPFSCLIILLDPEVFRITMHFGLAYICTLPMLFYWNIKYHDSRKPRWLLFIFLLGAVISLVHPYMGALILLWLVLYAIGDFATLKLGFVARLRAVMPVGALIVALIVYIKGFTLLTDPVTDRAILPDSTPEYLTHANEIFSSKYSPLWERITRHFGYEITPHSGEGYSYIGVAAILILFYSLVNWLASKIQRKPAQKLRDLNQWSPTWLFIALGALAVAMCIPFCWNFNWYLNYLPFLKQFRTIGRFSWIFYYIIAVYAVVLINNLYKSMLGNSKPILAHAVLLFLFFIWCGDANGNILVVRPIIADGRNGGNIFFLKNEIKWHEYLASKGHSPSDFQAILLSPVFYCGSEKLWVGGDPGLPMSIGLGASFELQLPIIDCDMSRTSWSVTEKQVKIIAGPFADKPMLRDLNSKKPFLFIHPLESDLDPDEKYLLEASDFIGNGYGAAIFACYPDRIIANDKKNADSIKAIIPFMHSGDTCLVNHGYWYADHFDSRQSDEIFFGTGAWPVIHQEDTILFTQSFRPAYDNQQYEFSCWFLLYRKNFFSPYCNLQFSDSVGNVINSVDVLTKLSVDNKGMWFRDSRYFAVSAKCRTIKCIVHNPSENYYKAMDELLLRPADAVIISKASDGRVLVNNHLLDGSGN